MRTIVLIGPEGDFTRSVEAAVAGGDFEVRRLSSAQDFLASAASGPVDIVGIIFLRNDAGAWEQALTMSRYLANTTVPLVVFGEDLEVRDRMRLFELGAKDCFSPEMPPEELAARLRAIATTKASLDRLRDEKLRTAIEARELRSRVARVDEQLRLAQRLQRDFLPKDLPEIPGARFAARLEPAAWVAGDFYDIFRLDEQHVGFYVADVVGHDMASALLTVFVKKSLQTKRIHAEGYELVMPDEALGLLNADLVSARLESSPFITLVYAIYNVPQHRLIYARAGHPRPLLIHPDGRVEYLEAEGPLLGIFAEASFELREVSLATGDRVLFYTDGVERCRLDDLTHMAAFEAVASRNMQLPLEEALTQILNAIQSHIGEDALKDDVTLVALAAE